MIIDICIYVSMTDDPFKMVNGMRKHAFISF